MRHAGRGAGERKTPAPRIDDRERTPLVSEPTPRNVLLLLVTKKFQLLFTFVFGDLLAPFFLQVAHILSYSGFKFGGTCHSIT